MPSELYPPPHPERGFTDLVQPLRFVVQVLKRLELGVRGIRPFVGRDQTRRPDIPRRAILSLSRHLPAQDERAEDALRLERHGHADLAVAPVAHGVLRRREELVDLHNRVVEPEHDLRFKSDDAHGGVVAPLEKLACGMARNEAISLDASQLLIVAGEDEFSRVGGVGEPDLVPDEEPQGVVRGVQVLEGRAGCCAGQRREQVRVHDPRPVDVLVRMFPEAMARFGYTRQSHRR